jgi:hypothetical protein
MFFLSRTRKVKKVKDFYFMIYALHGLGKVSMQQNQVAEAREFFEKALQARPGKQYLRHFKLHYGIGKFFMPAKMISLKQKRLSRQALAMREENHSIAGAITNCLSLPKLYINSPGGKSLDVLKKG